MHCAYRDGEGITKILLQRGALLVKKTGHSNLAYSILEVDKD